MRTLLLSALIVVLTSMALHAQPPAKQAAVTPLREADPADVNWAPGRDLVRHLTTVQIETKYFTTPMTLKDALGLIYEQAAAQGIEVPVLVNTKAPYCR